MVIKNRKITVSNNFQRYSENNWYQELAKKEFLISFEIAYPVRENYTVRNCLGGDLIGRVEFSSRFHFRYRDIIARVPNRNGNSLGKAVHNDATATLNSTEIQRKNN